jgi:hypothetical protein
VQITFETHAFVRSHGKQPRGRGSWAFAYIDANEGNNVEAEVFSPGGMTLTEAKRWFKANHKVGCSYVQILP